MGLIFIMAAAGIGWGLPAALQGTGPEEVRQAGEQGQGKSVEADGASKSGVASPPLSTKGEGGPIEVEWKDGLRFRTADKAFEAHVGGRVVLHGRTVFDRPDETAAPLQTVPDSFFFREAYLEAEAKIFQEFGVKVQADFRTGTMNQVTGGPASAVQGTLRDAYVSWKRWEEFNLRLGQFYEPISMEDQTSFRFVDFAERSVMNRLLTGREIGVEFRGSIEKGLVSYRVMLANGNSLLSDQGRAVVDIDDSKQFAGRLMTKPFIQTDLPFLSGLEIGVGGSVEEVPGVPAAGFDLTTTELSVLYLNSSATGNFEGLRTRLVLQLSWELGPVTIRGELLRRTDDLDASFPQRMLRSHGWYAYVTWLVTGETKKPETRVVPAGEWGAVELAFRFAQVEIDNAFAVLAPVAGSSDRVTSLTFGINWWIRSNIRLTANLVRESYGSGLLFDTGVERSLLGLIVRAQIDF